MFPTPAHTAHALRAHLAHFTQDTRLLRLSTSLGPDALIVECLDGREALSQPGHFAVTALCTDAHLDLSALLGQNALLQLLTQDGSLRSFHGHITACERLGADGGFARYRLTLEPWLAFLRHRRDSYVWQGKSVIDIIDNLFDAYRDQGMLAPAWRWALSDPGQYTAREVCTQFEESDLAFVERLLAEEGLFYWFEHRADLASPGLGCHTLVIADHNGAFTRNPQPEIRFHRAAAVERSDSITVWHARRRLGTNAITLGSWHEAQHRWIGTTVHSTHNNGEVPLLTCTDHPGARRFADHNAAERSARRHLQALEAHNKTYTGESTVRTLAPGTTFLFIGHAIHDADRHNEGDATANFAVISVEHHGRNNLQPEARTLIERLFANTAATPANDALYHNRFSALRADIPWRPLNEDGRGVLLHPKPMVSGVHTAIVVGHPGEDLSTERDHRIKVQMHWQRGARSHGRLAHPTGADNAPGNDGAYVWVRVAEPVAGPNFGSSFLPRIGQEVLLDYLEGDIDRPIVIGSLYNGKGMADAPGNQVAQGAGPALGNAPAWFAGASGEHAHNAILSGFKTQEIGHSQDGQGGYNALVFDDSTGQLGARLHTTQHATQLNLGHLKRQRDNERKHSHGHGVELRSDAHGALRAGQGMLLSADARPNVSSTQLDAREAHEQLRQTHALQQSLSDTAQQHHAFAGQTLDPQRHAEREAQLAQAVNSLAQTAQGTGAPAGGGAGIVPAFGRPDLVVSAPGGIALVTPQDLHASANGLTLTGGVDLSATAGRNLAVAVKDGISLFTVGDAKASRKDAGDKGIKLHAAQGKVDVQAQSAQVKLAADKDVHLTSTHDRVEAAAKEHVLLTAGGAYIRIGGGSIEIHAPGKVEFKAGMKVLDGPASKQPILPTLPKSDIKNPNTYSQRIDISNIVSPDENFAGVPYKIHLADGSAYEGITDKFGRTLRIFDIEGKEAKFLFGEGEWNLDLDAEHDN